MSKKRIIGILMLLFSTVIYVVVICYKIYSPIAYFIILGLLLLSMFFNQKFNVLSANFLFSLMFIYTVGFGPIILMEQGIQYNYDFFKIILGGFMAYCWGSLFFSDYKVEYKKEDKSKIVFPFSRVLILRVLYLASLFASIIYLYKNRTLMLNGNMQSGRIEAMAGSGLILYIMQLSIIVVPLLYEYYLFCKKTNFKAISKYELFFVTGLSSIFLLFSGFRAPLVSMYICLIIIYFKNNNKKIISLIPYGILIVLGVEVLGILRNFLSGSTASIGIIKNLNTSLIVNCINLKYIFNYFPNRIPFQNGYTYLINILMLKPGPDLDFTLWLKDQLNLSFNGGGVTPTILGEFYINFGLISIYIGMFFLGIFGNFITKYFNSHSYSFLGAFFIWQYAHCASGGIANVMILTIILTIAYRFVMMFPMELRRRNGKS